GGRPVVHVRPTVFLQTPFFLDWAAESIARDGTIRLPFGSGRTSPVDTADVAEVVAAILASPAGHVGKVYELTGPKSQDLHGLAAEYAAALGRPVRYVDVPRGGWARGGAPRPGPPGPRHRARAEEGKAAPRGPLGPPQPRRRGAPRQAGDQRPRLRGAARRVLRAVAIPPTATVAGASDH